MENDNVKLKNEKKVAIILVNYKDYAKKYLVDCFDSIRKQDYAGEMRIFITDNESTAESLALIKNIAPEAEVIANKNNDGFAKGNNDGMKKALKQGYEYVILFNLDTVLEPDCVRKMVEAAEDTIPLTPFVKGGKYQIGAVQARLMLYDDPSISSGRAKINSLGNVTHFLGFGYAKGYGEEYKSPSPSRIRCGTGSLPALSVVEGLKGAIQCNPPNPLYQGGNNQICYPSGAAALFTKEALEKVGLFDEEFWMYNEDQDLGWRLWLSGFKVILAPEAVVYHKYEFSRSIKKYYWLDRNRIMAILKNYQWATLVLILPAFIIMEVGLIFFAVKNGWFYEKMKGYSYFLNLINWRKIMAERKKVQTLRTAPDREIVKIFSGKIWYQEIGEGRLKVANVFFNAYWKIIRFLIRW